MSLSANFSRHFEDFTKVSFANSSDVYRPSDLLTSAEGQAIQQQVWKEIVDAIKVKAPEVERIAAHPK